MADRFVLGVPLGRWQTNCYVLGDRVAGTAVVVDPGELAAGVVPQLLAQAQVRCEAILLTHGHIDHIWSAPALADELDVPILLHPDDRWLWDSPLGGLASGLDPGEVEAFLGGPWAPPTERLVDLRDGQRLSLGGFEMLARHTPGHTPGHVTFLARSVAAVDLAVAWRSAPLHADDLLLSGDLIFDGSVGRTDFPRGSMDELLASIERTVLPLDDATLILSGHGAETTVGRERAANPFLRGVVRQRPGV